MFSLVPVSIAGLLAVVLLVWLIDVSLAGWERNFGWWFTACVALTAAIGTLGQSTFFQNAQNVLIAVGLMVIGTAVGFVVCYPFVCEKQGKKMASDFFHERYSGVPFGIDDKQTKLNNWTWYFTGQAAIIGTFWIKIHSKTGKIRDYHVS
jgi:hypothetical protein